MRKRILMLTILLTLFLVTGCGSVMSRTFPGQGKGHQFYPGVRWDLQSRVTRVLIILDLPFSLLLDTLLLPLDTAHGPYQ